MERSTQIPQKEKASYQREEIIDQLLAIRDSVSDFPTFLPHLLSYLHDCYHNFRQGESLLILQHGKILLIIV